MEMLRPDRRKEAEFRAAVRTPRGDHLCGRRQRCSLRSHIHYSRELIAKRDVADLRRGQPAAERNKRLDLRGNGSVCPTGANGEKLALFPVSFASWIRRMAVMWSMPGSSPNSFSSTTPASFALQSTEVSAKSAAGRRAGD